MTHFLLLAMWAASLTGWGNVMYFYTCGVSGKKPNYRFTINSLVAAIISLALGTICHSFIQSAIMSYSRMGI